MRVTVNLDDDVVPIARKPAERRGTTVGRVMSDMFRQALEARRAPKMRNGVPVFDLKKGVV